MTETRNMALSLFIRQAPEMINRAILSNPPLPYGGGLFGSPWTAGDMLQQPIPQIRAMVPTSQRDTRGRQAVDPLIGILMGLGHSKAEARSWASQIPDGTPEERWEEILTRKQAMLTEQRRMKAGMASTGTLKALVRQGCERRAEDVVREQGIDQGAIEEELAHIRAYAEGSLDLGTGSLIMDEERGDVTHRIGSGLPTWLQDLGGPKAILGALERRAGKLWDDLLALAIENVREPVPF